MSQQSGSLKGATVAAAPPVTQDTDDPSVHLTDLLAPLAQRLGLPVEDNSWEPYDIDAKSFRLLAAILAEILKRTDIALPPMQEGDLIGALLGGKEDKDAGR